jgi:hypothetical protein
VINLFAQAAPLGGYSLVQLAVAVVVVAAVIGLVYVALRQFQVPIPQWVVQVFWIVVVAIVAVAAIKVVASLF